MNRLKKNPDYDALKLGGRGAFGKASYWLGADHLLVVEIPGYVEKYRRFYFADIQAIVLQASRIRFWWNMVAGLLLAVPLVIITAAMLDQSDFATWSESEVIGFVVLAVPTLILITILAVNNARGPTASVHVRTAVQTYKLPGVTRRRRAEILLKALRPRIQAAQGLFTAQEQTIQLVTGIKAVAATPAEWAPPSATVFQPPPLQPYTSRAHVVLSWIALADVVGAPTGMLLGDAYLWSYSALFIPASVGASIVAILKQANTTLPKALRRLPGIVLAQVAGFFVLSLILDTVFEIQNPQAIRDGASPAFDDPFILALKIVSILVNGGLGLWGLLLWRQFKQGAFATEAPPTTPPAA